MNRGSTGTGRKSKLRFSGRALPTTNQKRIAMKKTKRKMRVSMVSSKDAGLLLTSFEVVAEKEGIEDKTSTNLVNLRRTIYLSIMNALNYEEAVHKLLKVQIQEGEEVSAIHVSSYKMLTPS